MMLWYRKATYKDILAIGPCLREADRSEFQAASGLTAEAALQRAFLTGDCVWCVLMDTTPIAVFGINVFNLSGGYAHGIPWACGTDLISQDPIGFLKGSREVLEAVTRKCCVLQNWVDSRNSVHIAWLRWMGFTIHDDIPTEMGGVSFYPFEYEYKPCAYQQPQ